MRVLDVRWIRLAVAAGAIVGSALVSSVAVAADEAASTEPPPTTPADVVSIDVDADVIIVDPPPDAPFEDIAVIEIVMPETEAIDSDAIEPAIEPVIVETAVASAVSVDESTVAISSEAMPFLAMETAEPGSHGAEEPGSEHEGGSGGQGNPYRMTFEVIWFDAGNQQITALDVVVPPEVLAQFELSATSQTGKGKVTSATCTYPDGGTVLRCEFHNPGHGSGSDGLIIPARPTATYTVTVAWLQQGWTISGADDVGYSARDLCPRGGEGGSGGHEEGGGHESGGGASGGGESGGHESGGGASGGGESGGHESGGGASGGEESGGHEGGGVRCVHTVLMRQVAAVTPPPSPPPAPPAPEPPAAAPPTQESAVVPPVVTAPAVTPTASAPVVQSAAAAPGSLPVTGGSISMILLIAGVMVTMGSALAGLTLLRRGSRCDVPLCDGA